MVESEVFVYNLGTMFYIDRVLIVDRENFPLPHVPVRKTTSTPRTTTEDIEHVPDEIIDNGGTMPDVLFSDAEATTGNVETTLEVTKSTEIQNATVK